MIFSKKNEFMSSKQKNRSFDLLAQDDKKTKLLVVCGPTGVGKTSLGIHLAKKFRGEIVSADSRQVYKKLDLGTGKDLENATKVKDWWEIEGVPLYLVDVAEPDEQFSVAKYTALALSIIGDIAKQDKLPILLGGTGLYLSAIVDGIDTLGISPNEELRKQYQNKTAEELLMILARLDPELANSLNKSEQYNKRRLIRRIEIAQTGGKANQKKQQRYDSLWIGVTCKPETLRERIEKRIDQWVKEGAEDEVRTLLEQGISWESQSMSALGYRQWQDYFEGDATREEVITRWKNEEYQYAKRQLTWFKKDPKILWFDIESPEWRQKVDKAVADWYHGSISAQSNLP